MPLTLNFIRGQLTLIFKLTELKMWSVDRKICFVTPLRTCNAETTNIRVTSS